MNECVMTWRPDDRLVFFPDGITDARDAGARRRGEASVLRTLGLVTPQETPDDILSAIFAVVDRHVGGTALRDDLAVVVVDRLT